MCLEPALPVAAPSNPWSRGPVEDLKASEVQGPYMATVKRGLDGESRIGCHLQLYPHSPGASLNIYKYIHKYTTYNSESGSSPLRLS